MTASSERCGPLEQATKTQAAHRRKTSNGEARPNSRQQRTGGIKMKKITTIIIALIMVLAMVATASAAGITKQSAVKKALKNAHLNKSQVKQLEVEYDKKSGKYEVEFIKKKNKAKYEYDISASKGVILEKSIDYKYRHNSSHHRIGKKAACKKAAKYTGFKLKTIKKGSCKYEYDDGEGTYEIKFRKGHYKYSIEILAPTGKVIEFEKDRIRK